MKKIFLRFSIKSAKKISKLSLTLSGEEFFGSFVEMPLSHCTVLLLVNKKKLYGKITFMQILSVLGVIFILILSTFFIYVLSAKLNEPVENLAQVMQDVGHGNFSLRAKVEGNDEIGYLAERFNHMLDNLENEKILKRQAELNALQYQIRPHFIYNTLNSIRFAAMIQGAKNIGELLANFIELLQVSTNREGEFGTLAEEIGTLKKYIALQEFRLMNSFAVDFNLSEESLSCRVPRLILQPFVENSILHAPSPEKTFCRIVIRSELQGGELIISVQDDGKGMSPEVLASLSSKSSEKKTHGGLSEGNFSPPKYTIGVVLKAMDSEHWLSVRSGMTEAAQQNNMRLIVITAENETAFAEQNKIISDLLANDIDALIVSPTNINHTKEFVDAAQVKNIPVFSIDEEIDGIAYIGSNNYKIGQMAAAFMSQNLPDGSEVSVISGSANQNAHIQRTAGFVD